MIFDGEGILLHVLQTKEVVVRTVDYLVSGRDCVFDLILPPSSKKGGEGGGGRRVFVRFCSVSRQGRDEWVSRIGVKQEKIIVPVSFILFFSLI